MARLEGVLAGLEFLGDENLELIGVRFEICARTLVALEVLQYLLALVLQLFA